MAQAVAFLAQAFSALYSSGYFSHHALAVLCMVFSTVLGFLIPPSHHALAVRFVAPVDVVCI